MPMLFPVTITVSSTRAERYKPRRMNGRTVASLCSRLPPDTILDGGNCGTQNVTQEREEEEEKKEAERERALPVPSRRFRGGLKRPKYVKKKKKMGRRGRENNPLREKNPPYYLQNHLLVLSDGGVCDNIIIFALYSVFA